MVPKNRTNLVLKGFAGGLVTNRPPLLLEQDESEIAENIEFDKYTIRRRDGWSKIHTLDLPSGAVEAVRGLYPFYFQTTKQLLATAGLYLMRSTGGDFTTVTSTFVPTSPARPTFATLNNACYIATSYGADLVQAIKKWDGTTFSSPAGTPNASMVMAFQNGLFAAGDTAATSRLRFSGLVGVSGPDLWPALNFIDIMAGDGDKITGLGRTLNFLLVLKERSLHRVSGQQPDDAAVDSGTIGVTSLDGQPGCVAPRSVASTHDFVIYLSRKGIYMYDGVQAVELSEPIRPFFEGLDENNLRYAVGGLVTPNHYLLSVLGSDGTTVNVVSLHLTPTLSFSVWKNIPVTAVASFQFTGELEKPVFGIGAAVGKGGGNADNGTAIAWKWRSSVLDMGNPFLIKTVRRGYIRAVTSDGTCDVKMIKDMEATGGEVSASLDFTATTTKRFVRPVTARGVQIEISGNGTLAPQIEEITFEFKPRYRP